jgi:hypothetical protein
MTHPSIRPIAATRRAGRAAARRLRVSGARVKLFAARE